MRQWAAIALAARRAGLPSPAASSACGRSLIGSGSSPRTTWLCRVPTAAWTRSAKFNAGGAAGSRLAEVSLAFDGLLQRRAGREARHAPARNRDPLAGLRVDPLALSAR